MTVCRPVKVTNRVSAPTGQWSQPLCYWLRVNCAVCTVGSLPYQRQQSLPCHFYVQRPMVWGHDVFILDWEIKGTLFYFAYMDGHEFWWGSKRSLLLWFRAVDDFLTVGSERWRNKLGFVFPLFYLFFNKINSEKMNFLAVSVLLLYFPH